MPSERHVGPPFKGGSTSLSHTVRWLWLGQTLKHGSSLVSVLDVTQIVVTRKFAHRHGSPRIR